MKVVYQNAIQKYEEYGKFLDPADLLRWTINHFGIEKGFFEESYLCNLNFMEFFI